MSNTHILREFYREFADSSCSMGYFDALREEFAQKLLQNGLPSASNEQYKYFDFEKRINESHWELSPLCSSNKHNSEIHSTKEPIVGEIIDFAKNHHDIFARYFDKLTLREEFLKDDAYFKRRPLVDDSAALLANAFLSCGNVVYIPKNYSSKEPLVLEISYEKTVFGIRDIIIVEKGAKISILLKYDLDARFVNRVSEIFLGENSSLEVVSTGRGSGTLLNSTYVELQQGSCFKSLDIDMKISSLRNNSIVNIKGKGADAQLYGAYPLKGNDYVDNFTLVEHICEDCTSMQLYKYVAEDSSTGIFNGRIYVAQEAQRTSAFQQNNNIIIDKTATIHTKPQLEIYADDVKCSHGATIGQLDDEAVYYMRQRGISEQEAKKLQMSGFIDDLSQKIDNARIKAIFDKE